MVFINSWNDKYKPNNISDIIGNKKNIELIKQWLGHFTGIRQFPDFKNGLLISGINGIGKTTALKIIIKQFKFNLIEISYDQLKYDKSVKTRINSIMNYNNIYQYIDNNYKTVLMIDNIYADTNNDRMCIKYIIETLNKNNLIKRKSAKKKIPVIVNKNPIILICNKTNSNINKLLDYCIHIKYNPPSDNDIYILIKKISKHENININDICCRLLVKNCQYDIQRVLYILYNLKLYFKNNPITISNINSVKEYFSNKDSDITLYESVNKVTYEKLTINQCLHYYNIDIRMIPLLIHENFNKNLRNNVSLYDKDKIIKMDYYYKNLIKSIQIEKHIYNSQNWTYKDYIGILSCFTPNIILNDTNSIRPVKYNTIKCTPVLSKINYKYYNLKIINKICKKISISIDNFQDFTSILYDTFIFNINKSNTSLMIFLKSKLDFWDIDKSIKLSYLYSYHGKLYTVKKKRELTKLYNSS